MIDTEVKYMKLYSEKQTACKNRKLLLWRILLPLFSIAALAVCACIVLHTKTGNAARSFWSCLSVFTLGGWFVILVRMLRLLPIKRVIAHEKGILNSIESPAEHIGVLTRAGVWFTLPSSITLMKLVLLTDDGEKVNLSVEKSRMKLLPKDGTRVKVASVRGFITEVEHEA